MRPAAWCPGGDVKGDVTTLEDFAVIAKLKEQEEA
jgi:hypothetical protein